MSAESLRPIPCRNPISLIENVARATVGGACLAMSLKPSSILSSSFYGGFLMYSYMVIRCNLLCMTNGESIISPRAAGATAGFFSGSTTAFLFRPALTPPQALALTTASTLFFGLVGLEEEVLLEEENKKHFDF